MDLVKRTLALVEISSVTGDEAAVCDYLAAQLQRCLAQHELIRIEHNLILRPKQRNHARLVALVGHLDTVPPTAQNTPRIEGDRLYGLGASDMKGGVALMWQLLAEPLSAPAFDVAYIFYSGEEGNYDDSGLIPVFAKLDWLKSIDLAVCLEPSDNVLQLGCMGTLHARLTVTGRAAHSARPWQGENAIYRALPLLETLAQRPVLDQQLSAGPHSLTYREVMVATLAGGGSARNVVPDSFWINLNYRFGPQRSLADAEAQVRELVAERAAIAFVDRSPSGPIPVDNAVLDTLIDRCQLSVAPKQAWTDVARFAEQGIDAVNWGPGQAAQAHQPDEYASVAHLHAGERLFRTFLSRE
ncbi:MAG: succinyl-diaminopimelate desuccinylase [Deltaproteobacteria bacterium]|nr:succinyl-diaminopimelate desuccinylase [Deltaproteobacteria bacterium]